MYNIVMWFCCCRNEKKFMQHISPNKDKPYETLHKTVWNSAKMSSSMYTGFLLLKVTGLYQTALYSNLRQKILLVNCSQLKVLLLTIGYKAFLHHCVHVQFLSLSDFGAG